MEGMSDQPHHPGPQDTDPLTALAPGHRLARGVARSFTDLGWSCLFEVSLKSGRRVDVMALDGKGRIAVVEVKSSLADYRSDQKWQEYLEFCDLFYFAVPEDFPREVLPSEPGLIITDSFQAAIVRESPSTPLAAARRKALTLRFARLAGSRLLQAIDPRLSP
jgi:hypothetical protein